MITCALKAYALRLFLRDAACAFTSALTIMTAFAGKMARQIMAYHMLPIYEAFLRRTRIEVRHIEYAILASSTGAAINDGCISLCARLYAISLMPLADQR